MSSKKRPLEAMQVIVDRLPPTPAETKQKRNKKIPPPLPMPQQQQPQVQIVTPSTMVPIIAENSEDTDILNLLMQDIHNDSNKEEIDLTVCPFHKCKLAIFQAESNGETYMKCQDKKCSLFSNMNNLQDYLRTIHENVHESYFKEGDLICKCEEPVSLKISRSESNPNRPFFSCKEPKEDSCGFFQWANKPLLKKNKNVQKKNA